MKSCVKDCLFSKATLFIFLEALGTALLVVCSIVADETVGPDDRGTNAAVALGCLSAVADLEFLAANPDIALKLLLLVGATGLAVLIGRWIFCHFDCKRKGAPGQVRPPLREAVQDCLSARRRLADVLEQLGRARRERDAQKGVVEELRRELNVVTRSRRVLLAVAIATSFWNPWVAAAALGAYAAATGYSTYLASRAATDGAKLAGLDAVVAGLEAELSEAQRLVRQHCGEDGPLQPVGPGGGLPFP